MLLLTSLTPLSNLKSFKKSTKSNWTSSNKQHLINLRIKKNWKTRKSHITTLWPMKSQRRKRRSVSKINLRPLRKANLCLSPKAVQEVRVIANQPVMMKINTLLSRTTNLKIRSMSTLSFRNLIKIKKIQVLNQL